VTFHNEKGDEIYRKDCDEQEIRNYLKVKYINICRNFLVTNKPKSWSVWVHSKSKQWVKQYTGNL
jgi:hypothetical protein